MFSTDDTIAAVATPPGRGGLGVVRLSGPQAHAIACRLIGREGRSLSPRHATFGRIGVAREGPECEAPRAFDHVICTFFPGPRSYTGDDVVEVSAHGSPVVLQRILTEAMDLGARLAQPGEFTLRAFLSGRLDLVQAEAVADLIDAVTPAQARVAFDQLEGTLTQAICECEHMVFTLISRLEASLDFPDEGYHFISRSDALADLRAVGTAVAALLARGRRGRVLREGAHVVVAGRPNVGKSSLFNALIGDGRAIVAARPGTTRDLLREPVSVGGIPVTLVDTAGLRPATDEIEQEGVARARRAAEVADLVLVLLDRSEPLSDEDRRLLDETSACQRLLAANKSDLPPAWHAREVASDLGDEMIELSALTGEGVPELREALARRLTGDEAHRDTPPVSNIRHLKLLEQTQAALARGLTAAEAGASEEFVLADLREASDALAEVTGRRTTEALLAEIFSRFCIGK